MTRRIAIWLACLSFPLIVNGWASAGSNERPPLPSPPYPFFDLKIDRATDEKASKAATPGTAAEKCDLIAGNLSDPDLPPAIRNLIRDRKEPLDLGEGWAACSVAIKERPDLRRLHYQLGRIYYRQNTYDEMYLELHTAANMGSAIAAAVLGRNILEGVGRPADIELGRKVLEVAASWGYADAYVDLASLYLKTSPSKGDIATGKDLLKKAVANGSIRGMRYLAWVLLNDFDTPAHNHIRSLYRKSEIDPTQGGADGATTNEAIAFLDGNWNCGEYATHRYDDFYARIEDDLSFVGSSNNLVITRRAYDKIVLLPSNNATSLTTTKYNYRSPFSELDPNVIVNGDFVKLSCTKGRCIDIVSFVEFDSGMVAQNNISIKNNHESSVSLHACNAEMAPRVARALKYLITANGGKPPPF